jgi:hypothetical protein
MKFILGFLLINLYFSSVFAETAVTITRLHCHETEDYTGADECLLKIFKDGHHYGSYRQDMNNGNDWSLNITTIFSNKVEIELWDEDAGLWDDDDFLGRVTITRDNSGGRNGNSSDFTLDGARYTIYWNE